MNEYNLFKEQFLKNNESDTQKIFYFSVCINTGNTVFFIVFILDH